MELVPIDPAIPGVTKFDAVCGIAGESNKYYFFNGNNCWRAQGGWNEPFIIQTEWVIEGPFDAICGIPGKSDKYYIFKGHYVWLNQGNITYPAKLIKDEFQLDTQKLKIDNLDAVCSVPNKEDSGSNIYYFFKGQQYWKFARQVLEAPKTIEDDWGLDGPFDAVCAISGDTNVYYIFKGRNFYTNDGSLTGPQDIVQWYKS